MTPLDMRKMMIKRGLELEIKTQGRMRLTGKAPPCFTIIKNEDGIKARRARKDEHPMAGKYEAYVAYCEKIGETPRSKAELRVVDGTAAPVQVNAPGGNA